MSQHNEKNPHQHQSPLHDSSEAKPGMDSLAPEDGSHRPAAEPTPPGAQPTAPGSLKAPDTRNEKLNSLEDVRKGSENYALTTNQGVRIADDQNSLRAGSRGPTLLEDFILREKITHFDHERIPERIVHARGSAAHGYFQPYKSLSDITKADFLSDPNKITPVFVRFSTVQGGAGSADGLSREHVFAEVRGVRLRGQRGAVHLSAGVAGHRSGRRHAGRRARHPALYPLFACDMACG